MSAAWPAGILDLWLILGMGAHRKRTPNGVKCCSGNYRVVHSKAAVLDRLLSSWCPDCFENSTQRSSSVFFIGQHALRAGGCQMTLAYHHLPGCTSCGSCQWHTTMGAMTSGPSRLLCLRAAGVQSCLKRSCCELCLCVAQNAGLHARHLLSTACGDHAAQAEHDSTSTCP